mmetsp:Transcript_34702/g.109595  ORF Transcript_34702/g.109595 Transcript_34702/m.109595 type:complete len:274 (+) Transcript_34702:276-1097(+)
MGSTTTLGLHVLPSSADTAIVSFPRVLFALKGWALYTIASSPLESRIALVLAEGFGSEIFFGSLQDFPRSRDLEVKIKSRVVRNSCSRPSLSPVRTTVPSMRRSPFSGCGSLGIFACPSLPWGDQDLPASLEMSTPESSLLAAGILQATTPLRTGCRQKGSTQSAPLPAPSNSTGGLAIILGAWISSVSLRMTRGRVQARPLRVVVSFTSPPTFQLIPYWFLYQQVLDSTKNRWRGGALDCSPNTTPPGPCGSRGMKSTGDHSALSLFLKGML